jgi:hypothetical protein
VAEGASGTLVYTDRDCRFHALRLPSLDEVRPPSDDTVDCWFELSADGRRIAPAQAAWNGSREYALCDGRNVEVRESLLAIPREVYEGCAPSWRPGRRQLTLARDGEVIAVAPACDTEPPCETVLLSRAAVLEAARQHPNVPDGPGAIEEVEIEDVAWLSADRAVLLLRIGIAGVGPQDLVSVFEGGRVRGSYYFFDDDRDRLEVSRRSRYIAAGTAFAVRADGPRLAIPDAFGEVRAVAWSPDERWLALAARGALALVRVGTDTPRVLALPIDATDVAWAPE